MSLTPAAGATLCLSLLAGGCAGPAGLAARGAGGPTGGVAEGPVDGTVEPLAAGSLSDRITDPMVAIRHDRGAAQRYKAVAVVYHLDGLLLFARRLDRTRPPETDLPVFEGRLRPGRHTISVHLALERLAEERLSASPVGRTTLSATQGFLITEGQFAAVTAQVREIQGGGPTVDFDIRFRPIRAD